MAIYCTTRRVEFRDTDAAGLMHFSTYFTRMEEVEHEWRRHLGTSVHVKDEQGLMSWPRVDARCSYRGPARFEDVLAIELRVERLGSRSLTCDFRFLNEGREVARGQLTTVCCRLQPDHPPRAVAIPAWFRDLAADYSDPFPNDEPDGHSPAGERSGDPLANPGDPLKGPLGGPREDGPGDAV